MEHRILKQCYSPMFFCTNSSSSCYTLLPSLIGLGCLLREIVNVSMAKAQREPQNWRHSMQSHSFLSCRMALDLLQLWSPWGFCGYACAVERGWRDSYHHPFYLTLWKSRIPHACLAHPFLESTVKEQKYEMLWPLLQSGSQILFLHDSNLQFEVCFGEIILAATKQYLTHFTKVQINSWQLLLLMLVKYISSYLWRDIWNRKKTTYGKWVSVSEYTTL